jgi:protein gp37
MNKTKIEWCDRTWNPVTGCYHNCPYCYAAKIADRFKPKDAETWDSLANMQQSDYPLVSAEKAAPPFVCGFIPTLYYGRLDEPIRKKKPQNIFVCSMADLFGDWVPDEWIEAVFEACEKAPQHRYLFLTKNRSMTKNEKRLSMLQKYFNSGNTSNKWLGYSVESGYKLASALNIGIKNTFLSMEPLAYNASSPFKYGVFIKDVKWVIIGAETGNRKGKIVPNIEPIKDIVNECRERKISVFMKDSLKETWGKPLIQEYPWETPKTQGAGHD